MFDVGWGEALLVGAVAVIVLGPERLPAAAARAARTLREAQRQFEAVRAEAGREVAAAVGVDRPSGAPGPVGMPRPADALGDALDAAAGTCERGGLDIR